MIIEVKEFVEINKPEMEFHQLCQVYLKETFPIPEVFFLLKSSTLSDDDFNFWVQMVGCTSGLVENCVIPVVFGDDEKFKRQQRRFGWIKV